jgi:hypothetical protein
MSSEERIRYGNRLPEDYEEHPAVAPTAREALERMQWASVGKNGLPVHHEHPLPTVAGLAGQLEASVWQAQGAEIRSLKLTLARLVSAQADALVLMARLETRIEKLEADNPHPADTPPELPADVPDHETERWR